jgi:hypothetical protein
VERDNSAYGMDEFAFMAYCVFNEDMCGAGRRLIVKSRAFHKYAVSMVVFCIALYTALLGLANMKRLPAPALPYDGSLCSKGCCSEHLKNRKPTNSFDDDD